MESFLSAALGELMTRTLNFIVTKCSKPPAAMAVEESLQKALLRAQVIMEEAMGRHITNQAMIQQLGMLIDAMHRGYYALDAFRYQPDYEEDDSDQVVSRFMSLCKVPSAKHPHFFSQTAQLQEQLQEALNRLSSMIADLNELVMFLGSYPRLCRQPYSMHILLGNCMFGRQVEAELVVKFLLHTQPHSSQELEVLPIIGPVRVGKSTLVTHICRDERVRDYFSEILWLCDSNFINDELACRQGCVMNHRNCMQNSNGNGLLVVIELSADIYEDAWNRWYLSSKQRFPNGSKIIVTSRSDKIAKFGTTPAVTLKFLSKEASWYFFKTLTFGSMDPEKHPRLSQLAMGIARVMHISTFNVAYVTSYMLRENFNTKFWCSLLSFLRGFIQKHVSDFGVHPFDLLKQNKPVLRHGTMAAPSEYFMICHQYQGSSQEEVPKISIQDLLYGSIKRHGTFEVLAWRSQIPPYYSYINTCEIREQKTTGSKRKRSMKDGFTYC